MKLGIEKARSHENFESLWFVVSKALGGGDNSPNPTKDAIEAGLALGSEVKVVDDSDEFNPFKGLDESVFK